MPALFEAIKVIRPDSFAAWQASLDSPLPPAEASGSPRCPPPCDVLILAANPRETPILKLRAEATVIREALKAGKGGLGWRVCWMEATRAEQLTELLRNGDPRILHFSGHGNETGELLFEDADRFQQPVPLEDLARLIAARKGRLECVVFNACFSIEHADILKPHVRCIIGMSRAIDDRTSLRFAKIFYEGLVGDPDYRKAYDVAMADLEIVKLPAAKAPRFVAGDK
jgi:hypothetical protein